MSNLCYSSARSQVLTTYELLDIILSYVDSNKELLALSLTCKTIFNPGMDRMWRTLYCFFPLLNVIPNIVNVDGTITTTRVLKDEDISRFIFYAHRIQTLEISGFATIMPYIYQFLARARERPLFPLLKKIHVKSVMHLDSTNELLLFLISSNSPSLTSAIINDIQECVEVPAAFFLQELACNSKNVLQLNLSGELGKILLDIIGEFTRLANLELTLTFTDNFPDFVKVVSSLPCLENLVIKAVGDLSQEQTLTGLERASFQNLHTLQIQAPSDTVSMIFCAIYPTALESLTLTFTDEPDEMLVPHIDKTIRHIISASIAKSVKRLKLGDYSSPIPWGTFLPLYNSQLLCIEAIDTKADYIGKDILHRNPNWKTLQTLRLTTPVENPANNSISISDLPLFTELCPALRLLGITVSILGHSETEKIRSHSKAPCSCHGLRKLYLSCLAPTDTSFINEIFVGRFIDNIFPQLTIFKALGFSLEGNSKNLPWSKGVQTSVTEFREVRRKAGHICCNMK